ncbi:MAG: suppressor of fused domain protein [Myxococcota bacterium]
MMKHNVQKHLEQFLGRPQKTFYPDDRESALKVLKFENIPTAGSVTYATSGLGEHELSLPEDVKTLQELVFAVDEKHASDDLAKLLFYVADGVAKTRRALIRGETIDMVAEVVPGTMLTNLYVSNPTVFPAGFQSCWDTDPLTIFVWLVPLTDAEADFARIKGWNWFEKEIEKQRPNLLDAGRAGMKIPELPSH